MLYLRPDFASALAPHERRFAYLFGLTGELHREHAGRRTLRFHHHGRHYFLKAHPGVGWKEIWKNLVQFKLPVISAVVEWRALHRLRELHIDTLSPVAYGVEGSNPAARRSFLITEDLGDTINLEEVLLRQPPVPVQIKRALLLRVAEIARTMHEHGVNHRDFYLCHLRVAVSDLRQSQQTSPIPVYVMDLHRAQLRRRRTPERWIVKDLAGLHFSSMRFGLTRQDRCRFITAYEGRPLRDALRSSEAVWNQVARRARRLYRKHYPAG